MAKTQKKKAAGKSAAPKKVKAKPSKSRPAVAKPARPASGKPAAKAKPAAAQKAQVKPKAKAAPATSGAKNAKPAPKAKPAPAAKTKPVPQKKEAAKPVVTKVAEKPAAKPVAKPEPPPVQKPVQTSSRRSKPAPQVIDPDIPVIHLDKPPADLKDSISKVIRKKIAPGERRLVKTDTINPHIIKDKPLEQQQGKKVKPEPKGKFVMEYILHAPVALLYDFLTTPNGMAEWFAEGVDLKNDMYTFDWDGAKQQAKIVSAKLDSSIRLRWLDKPEDTYFEFQINADELTGEIQLLVTDFGDGEDDIKTSRHLWETQIGRLKKALGSY